MEFTRLMTDIAGVGALSTHAGFNVCTYTGAGPVDADLARLAAATGITVDRMVFPLQTHTARVATINRIPAGALPDVDAVVTALPGILLGVNTADCLSLLMADPQAGVIAACHCGWRGTAAGIAGNTLQAMIALGARAERICAALGPHICADCFEVGEEVAARFAAEAVARPAGRKPRVDLAQAVALQLPGVKIDDSGLCTATDRRFYSVRRMGYGLKERTLSAIFRPI